MRRDSSSDVAASEAEDERSITAVADEPGVTRERAPEIVPGDVLAGRYQIEAVIGKGGSGVVVRAFDRVSTTVVAVKILKTALTHDPRWEKRFQRELRLGRPIQHSNVCRIFDIGDADGYRFLTMEYAKGGTLRDLIKKNQPLRPLEARLKDAADVIGGLAAIHEAGIVHRDVKPDNMLRMDDGRLVLSDFGLATDLPDNTMVSVFVGTPHYMAPEVREGDPATTRSDVWSFGVVLHEIFLGKRPDRRASRTASGVAKSSTASTSSSAIERAMLALCLRCLADDPSDRPKDARAVQRLFEDWRRSPQLILRTPRRRLVTFATAAALFVAAALGVGVRIHRRASVPMAGARLGIPRLTPTGVPADWSNVANVIATVPGRVHCFSLVDDNSVRIIWGTPRKAEDIRMDSGARRVAPLMPDTYLAGCPDLSPDRHQLLFTANTSAGGTEIRHSANPDGTDPKPVTAGSDPVWLTNGEEFAYSIDATHTALFSLPTMRFRLLADPGVDGLQTILAKAASPNTDALALILFGTDVQWALTVYEGPGLNQRTTFSIPAARRLRLDSVNDRVFVSPLGPRAALASLDWHTGTYRNVGSYSDIEMVDVLFAGERAVVLGRKRTQDVWLYGSSGKKRLTNDGEAIEAAISPTGRLLLAKAGPGVTLNIWSRDPDGALKRLTNGKVDTSPDFSPDGRSWVYVDYPAKSIMICTTDTNECRVLRRDEMLPALPRFSPDGSKVAYIRQSAVPRLLVVSVSDGKDWSAGDTHWQCPPVWSSANNIWGFEGSAGRYFWAERDVERHARTGRRVEIEEDQSATNDEIDCWPKEVDSKSPFYRRLRVETEERSSVLRLPRRNVVADGN